MPVLKVVKADTGLPVKVWTDEVEESALAQLKNMSQMPFIHKWIACMPDVHMGYGATIGSVIPASKAIIPSAVGVDIGCGMIAVQTGLTANDLPDNLKGVRSHRRGASRIAEPGNRGTVLWQICVQRCLVR